MVSSERTKDNKSVTLFTSAQELINSSNMIGLNKMFCFSTVRNMEMDLTHTDKQVAKLLLK